MSNILGLWIKNLVDTDAKHKLSAFRTVYNFNTQYDGAAIFFNYKNGATWHMHRILIHQYNYVNHEGV